LKQFIEKTISSLNVSFALKKKEMVGIFNLTTYIVCLLVCFEPHDQFFSYLVAITIAGDKAANIDLCLLALTVFSSEGSFTCHTYCDTGPPFSRSYPKDL
jgi:hypothetical protein